LFTIPASNADCTDSVDVPGELHHVQVAGEDVFFGHALAELQGQLGLLHLAGEGVGAVLLLSPRVLPVDDVDEVVLE
jgi:hypothetical protein